MKKLIILIIALAMNMTSNAQDTVFDYIHSEEGFEVKDGVITIEPSYIGHPTLLHNYGLYSKDGKFLIYATECFWVENGVKHYSGDFYVLDGTEVICSNAFINRGGHIYIPSSVKQIAPDCLGRFYGISDECKESKGSVESVRPSRDISEGRLYNINGIRLTEETTGINIIHKSDGTTEKRIKK